MKVVESYKVRSRQLEAAACKAAGQKLSDQHTRVQDLWHEAHSIPAGCGCTPFYSDARYAEKKLRQSVIDFQKKFGFDALNELELFYGMSDK